MQKVILCALFLYISIGFFANASAEDINLSGDNSGILIYSFSHGTETETETASGILQISISAFDPVTSIHINGRGISFIKDTKVDVSHPYQLNRGRNDILAVVTTEKGEQKKRFVIYYGKKPKPKKSALQFIGVIGNSNLDNVTSVVNGGEELSGSKLSLTLIPIYRLLSGLSSSLKLKGIVLREKFSENDFSGNEISYTKIAIEWKDRNTFLGEISAESGLNDIRTDNENPLLGKDESVSEAYLSGMMAWKLGKANKLDLKLEYKIKDSKAEFSDPDVETDAVVMTLDTRFHFQLTGFKSTGKLGYRTTDAKGKYMDSSMIRMGLQTAYPFDRYTPGLSYDTKQTTMKISNPLYGNITPQETLSVLTLKLGYQIFRTGKIMFQMKNKVQSASIETSEYSANETVLSYTQIF